MAQLLSETVWPCIKRLTIELPYDSAISPLGMHTKKTKQNPESRNSNSTCLTAMCSAILVTVAKRWKPAKRPSTEERTNNMWPLPGTEYYSAIKRNQLVTRATAWTDPVKGGLLSKRGQTRKDRDGRIPLQ